MDDTTPGTRTQDCEGSRGPQRSFARGFLWAAPVAVALWLLILYFV